MRREMGNAFRLGMGLLVLTLLVAGGCEQAAPPAEKRLKVGMVLDTGGEKDAGYNEYSLKGAREAAATSGIDFEYLVSDATTIYERNIEKVIAQGADLILTVGFGLANATAKAATRFPDRHFVIMDSAYYPGSGCPDTVQDCYTSEGGLSNVTSLLFAEDQPAYLAGVLAACMSETGILGAVAGYEIPPVVRFVNGFANGARSVRPDVRMLKRYIPDFNDRNTGRVVAMEFISKGADVLFCVAGTTGLGGLAAAKEAGIMAVGADVDQYITFPEAGSAIITSVMKKVDVAARLAVEAFAGGALKPGIHYFTLENRAVGLAPFHEWENHIPETCIQQVETARQNVLSDPDLPLSKPL